MRAKNYSILSVIGIFIFMLFGFPVYGQSIGSIRINSYSTQIKPFNEITLTKSSVAENQPNGTVVGVLHVASTNNAARSYHFILINNAGSRFALNDSLLVIKNTNLINYEQRNKYKVTIRAVDTEGDSFEQTLPIKILDANDPPTSIQLSNKTIAENSPAGAIVGNITGTDPDSADVLTFSVVQNPGNNFTIHDNHLVVADSAQIDFEKTPQIPITLRATDKKGATLDKSFIIDVLNRNDAPTAVHLSQTSIKEDSPVGTFVGIFSTVDEDTADGHDYDLLNNANGAFALFGNALVVADSTRLNYEADSTLTIKVRSTDDGGLSVIQPLTIHIQNVNEPPEVHGITNLETNEDVPTDTLYFRIHDPETPARFLSVLASTPDTNLVADSNIVIGGSQENRWMFIRSNHDSSGTAQINVKVSDGVNVTTKPIQLTVHPVNDYPVIATNDGLRLDEGTGKVFTTKNLNVTDVDNTSKQVTFTVTNLPTHGTLLNDTTRIKKGGTFSQYDIDHGRIKYVHDGSETISDQFKFNISDGAGGRINKQYFNISINPVNDPPTITQITNIKTLEDTPTPFIPFKIHDEETPASYLELSATSTNSKLLPDSSIVLGGVGSNRTIEMKPAPNQNGSTIVSVVVSDGEAHKVDRFKLIVKPVDDPPYINPIADQETKEDQPIKLKFKVGDIDTPLSKLKIWAKTSDENLVPKENIKFTGSGNNRKMLITPGNSLYGKADITLFCSDGDSTTKTHFHLNIKRVNKPPEVFALYGSDTYVDTDTMAITFAWQKAVDRENNPVSYDLHIKGDNYDTTITNIKKTKYVFTKMNILKANSLYDWYVTASDGQDTTESLLTKDFIAPKVPGAPRKYVMTPNYPNPFNPTTTIHYQIPVASKVILSIYDTLGRKVTELVHKQQAPGSYNIQWNAAGQASGVYIYQIVAISDNGNKHYVNTKKMLLVK